MVLAVVMVCVVCVRMCVGVCKGAFIWLDCLDGHCRMDEWKAFIDEWMDG